MNCTASGRSRPPRSSTGSCPPSPQAEGAEDCAGRRSGEKRLCAWLTMEWSGPHRHGDSRLRTVPEVHPGVEHRQGAARRRLSGVDRSASGASPRTGFPFRSAASVRRRPGSQSSMTLDWAAWLAREVRARLTRGATPRLAFPTWATIPMAMEDRTRRRRRAGVVPSFGRRGCGSRSFD